jgi:hypothetical protein
VSCFVPEHRLWQAIPRSLVAHAVLFLSIRVWQGHVVTVTAKVAYLPAGKVPEASF